MCFSCKSIACLTHLAVKGLFGCLGRQGDGLWIKHTGGMSSLQKKIPFRSHSEARNPMPWIKGKAGQARCCCQVACWHAWGEAHCGGETINPKWHNATSAGNEARKWWGIRRAARMRSVQKTILSWSHGETRQKVHSHTTSTFCKAIKSFAKWSSATPRIGFPAKFI